MINKKLSLSRKIFAKEIELKSTRDGFGEGLVEVGEKDERVVAISADLKESTRLHLFAQKFPERFFEVGVAEQALVTIASGMANYGKIPFVASYASFSPGRNWEQIKTTIALNDVPVKIVGAHAGLSASIYGATHMGMEDLALMRTLPNMLVIVPCDALEAKKATLEAAKNGKPTYIRLVRDPSSVITNDKTPFKIGKGMIFWESKNPLVTIVATGPLLYQALQAAEDLEKKGIESLVINCHTVKPLDEQTIIRAAKSTGAVVTIEDHQIAGGLGSAVAEVLSRNFPVPIEFVGINDSFGESGKPAELYKKFGLTKEGIIEAAKRAISRKNF